MRTILSKIKTNRFKIAWYLQLIAGLTYVILGVQSYAFVRPGLWMYPVGVVCGVICEIVFCRFIGKKPSILSGVIASTGTFILLSSKHPWAYIFTTAVVIGSKMLFRVRNIHFFNPVNIGVLTFLCLFPKYGVMDTMQWHIANNSEALYVVLVLGGITTIMADRWVSTLAFVGGFLFWALVRTWVNGVDFSFYAMPAIGAMVVLYSCHTITDPVTSPSRYPYQILYGVSIAGVDQLLRQLSIFHSVMVSLAIVTLIRAIFMVFESEPVAASTSEKLSDSQAAANPTASPVLG
jgi:Na+-transporting NADH:ubiquinone oxidoreductase subunit NqrB